MRKIFLFAIVLVVLMFPSVAVNYPYTATQVANLSYDEITHVLRTLMIAIGPYQINSRNYTLDQIFNLVYDSTNHALRVSATGPGIAPDSANEWSHAWIDTAFAKHYASKAGLALDFWMRGTRGDTLCKFHKGPVVVWFDTLGSAWFAGRVTSRADSTDTLSASRFKLIGQYNYIPWCTSINTWGAQGFITGWYKDTIGMVGNPPLHGSYIGVSLRQKYFKNNSLAKEVWSIRGGGYKSANDSTREAWRFPLAIVDPGDLGLNTDAFSRNGSQRIRFATPFYWFKVDTVCVPDSVAWVDTTGQIHTPGIDLLPRVVAPLDSHKIWASEESLWFNDKVGVFHPIWPAAAAGAGSAFGDTNTYYVSVASFGAGRDSLVNYYFSGKRALQTAINRASVAGTKTNRKTVYVFPGYYVNEPCTLKPYVNLVGAGKTQTVIQYTAADSCRFTTSGARYFSVQNLQVQNFMNTIMVCSLATASCTSAYYKGDIFTMNPGGGGTCKYVFKATGECDSVLVEDVVFGDEPQQLDVGVTNGSRWGELYLWVGASTSNGSHIKMKNCRQFSQYTGTVNGTFHYAVTCTSNYQASKAGIEFEDCHFLSRDNNMLYFYPNNFGQVSIRNCSFKTSAQTYDTVVTINNYYGGWFFYLYNTSFTGRWATLNGTQSQLYFVNCALEANLTTSVFPIMDSNTFTQLNGFFEWRDATAGRTWYYGGVHFDTSKTTVPATPRNGMTWFKANASPNDTIYSYMDDGWRNLDRTWATGRDSVLVNQASDTLAITGIQTTSFVEVQLESDPGVNIGSPYHTLTANQDILIWPVACVNKFYYRWRIH